MTAVPEPDVRTLVEGIHARPEDLSEGDLGHRLEKFTHYVRGKLKLSDIDLDEWLLDDDEIDRLADLPTETRPPVVYDAVSSSMIDGIHRANAALRKGETEIDAFIGTEAHLDPDWSSEPEAPDW